MCTTERSYPNVGVGQILKGHIEYFSSHEHFSKLKRRTQTWVQMTKCVLLKGLTLTLVRAKY